MGNMITTRKAQAPHSAMGALNEVEVGRPVNIRGTDITITVRDDNWYIIQNGNTQYSPRNYQDASITLKKILTGFDMTEATHGGKRPGAGRKRKFDDLARRTVTLPPAHVEWLEKLGDGNLSAGIRLLVEKQLK